MRELVERESGNRKKPNPKTMDRRIRDRNQTRKVDEGQNIDLIKID
jgi:hypothetical protein